MATWKTIPGFGDEHAKTTEWVHEASGAKMAEVLYDAHDRAGNSVAPDSDADGHGRWLGIQISGGYEVVLWQHPRKSGGKVDYGFGGRRDVLADIEASLAQKERLIAEAETIAEGRGYGGANVRRMSELMESWRKVRAWHVPREDELWGRFRTARHAFYEGRDAQHAEAKAAKEGLAAEAEALLAERDFRNGSARMRDLMDRWKQVPSAGRSADQALWERFNGARNEFFTAQHEHHERRQAAMARALDIKESLVDRATQLANAKDFSRAGADEMRSLTDEWKAAGSAGRERDNALWARFRDAQRPYWDARKVDGKRRHAEWEVRHEAWCQRMEKVIAAKERDIERIEDDVNYLEFKKTTAEGPDALAAVERQLADAEARLDELRREIADIRSQMRA